jgi:hypothetical protein
METDVPFALCRIHYSLVKIACWQILIRTLTIMANVQVKTKMTDLNLLLLRPSMTGAIDATEFSDLMSSGSPVVVVVGEQTMTRM